LGTRDVMPAPEWHISEMIVAIGYLVYQAILAAAFLRFRSRPFFYAALPLALLPLVAAKFLPSISPMSSFGFAGISYVTFRALDVVFSIHDGVIKHLSLKQYFAFLFFFPTISSGPVDRYRRFTQDWERRRSRAEFLLDLDEAVARIFRGFLYKFIIAALIEKYWVKPLSLGDHPLHLLGYMYSYSLYLFFDFAGYSAFAIGIGYLLGVRTPENFNLPFLARNIRDFWNRWHITLSFWFRDHVYMRFLLAAARGKWFKGKHTASYFGLFLTFGLMGIWHGTQLHFILYGLYHAALLSGYDWFARWNKQRKLWPDGPVWRIVNMLLTFHAVCFGLLLFSGRLG
ncbi:MAG: D-alanyl-lipoteichoic acid biosynthesis protein DltB, partial [Verrucomicrobiota bacterium]